MKSLLSDKLNIMSELTQKANGRLFKMIMELKIILVISLVLLFSVECVSSRKNPYYEKRIKASRVNVNQLGRNKYYFSKEYQKKLAKSFKKK